MSRYLTTIEGINPKNENEGNSVKAFHHVQFQYKPFIAPVIMQKLPEI